MSARRKVLAGLLAGFFLILPLTWAEDVRLKDAIQEFGEKRFIQTTPTRVKAGPFKLHPSLETRTAYDTNILGEKDDPKDDVVFNIRPGAILEIPIQKHQLALGYEADFENFVKRTNQNDQNQNFFALADFNFPSWYVNVYEELSETSDRAGTTFTERIPRFDQTIDPKIGYRWKRWTFETGFRHFTRDFRRQADDSLDFQLVEWRGVIFYDLFARLKALLDYQTAQIDYDDNYVRNGTFHQARIGLEGEIFPNLMLKIRLGPQLRNYEVPAKPDFRSWVGKIILEYQARKNFALNLFFTREPAEATFGDVNFYKIHAVGAGFDYTFRPKWTLFGDADYGRHNYAERATLGGQTLFRRDHLLHTASGLRYRIHPSLELELAYEYFFRGSNFSEFEHIDNIFYLRSRLAY